MRLVAGLLALTLTGTLAFADEVKAPEPQPEVARPKVALRVVRVMAESHQALLFDKNQGKHVLADVGSVIAGYTVMAIDEDEVTLSSGGRELVLSAPDQSWRRRRAGEDDALPATPAKAAPAGDTIAATPADPYAAPAIDGPADPYADLEKRIAEAPAPIVSGEGGVRVARAPNWVSSDNPYEVITAAPVAAPTDVTITEMEVDPYGEPAPAAPSIDADPYAEIMPTPAPAPAPVKPATKPAKPAKKGAVDDDGARAFADAMGGAVTVHVPEEAAPAPAAPAAPAAEPATILARKDVNAALTDFGLLTASVRGSFTADGARLDQVAPGSVFAKAGLRNGDVITAVDGQPVKSIDDAADLYIRAGAARTMSVKLVRGGKPMTLRLAIQ